MKNEDQILDSGASHSFMNSNSGMTNFNFKKEKLYFPDHSFILITGTGDYGTLKNVKVAPQLKRTIISEGSLTTDPYNYIIIHDDTKAYVYDQVNDKVIATATRKSDNLYYIDDLTKFKELNKSNYTVLDKQITNSAFLHGSSCNRYKATEGDLNKLELLHVICGHMSEATLKLMGCQK
jgi:hypothetical protein